MCKAVQEGILVLSIVPKSIRGGVGLSTAASLGDKELCHLHHRQAMRNVKKPVDQMPLPLFMQQGKELSGKTEKALRRSLLTGNNADKSTMYKLGGV